MNCKTCDSFETINIDLICCTQLDLKQRSFCICWKKQKLSKSNAEALTFVVLQSKVNYNLSNASGKQLCDVPLKKTDVC